MMEHNQSTIATYMAIMAERDAAIRERNMSLEERKKAFAERDMAMLQRDAAISERNSAIQERDEAISALRLLDSSRNENSTNRVNHNYFQHQMNQIVSEVAYSPRGNLTSETENYHFEEVASETAKPKVRRAKKSTRTKSTKSARVAKGRAEGSKQPEYPATLTGSDDSDDTSDDEQSRPNQIIFDEIVMPTPVCTCTGLPQPCYRWGNGGWQSACCTTAISMYPLPPVSNKSHTRVGGRKMSGSTFSKLLNHIASEGYDLSNPLDLKDHWAKHGTNRYTTARNYICS